MSHRNARLTVHGRRTIVERVLIQGRPRSHVAKEMGVSRQCVSRWIARYQAEGEPGLQERSSRPHHPASRTCPEVEQRVLAVREDERRGQDWIGPELGVPARTVSRILRRHRVPYLRELDPMTGEVIRSSKATAVRYERDRPGELVHMDVKKIGRIPDGGGWRATAAPPATPIAPIRSVSTTSTRWSMTTPGWPTPRSCPMRRAPPAPASWPGPPPISPRTASPASSG